MINLHDVKAGDTVIVEYEGEKHEGLVLEVNREDKQVCVQTGEQEFWYELADVYPIPLSEEQLLKLQFTKENISPDPDNRRIYVRGPFSVMFHELDGREAIRLDYRDEHREIKGALTVNQLQNHYHAMTNFHLD
ncbi:MAG: hypothetical protein H6Q26_457 [Bacteroidetes bacterium]|uniref:hypothetical protein n=1 Tax=Chitinophaga TaxID=79328 RepID=UPI0009CE13E6|nr:MULTISPECIES: hypothetical protein [Chitinophaga]MBP1650300.1 hypothetical protein [Bacteroidota bacterium]OMP80912.1 hypothetical protein BW716_02585 [[Flexibacter] sp. ATCC 35208]WPQ65469.1 hypothetical protein SIO70_11480 [Chitinophaga sancti]WPV69941.1 hypothetical protein QQL36_14650 [Chitinophaga sp. LS1]